MDVIASGYAQANPTHADAKSKITVGFLLEDLIGNQRQTYAMLFAAVAAVLLIACANVANLVLARFSRRRKEIGIRFALGARRSHNRRAVSHRKRAALDCRWCARTDLAAISLQLLTRIGNNFIPRVEEISLDPMVLVFTLGVSIVAGLILGVVPAMQPRCMR